MSGKKWRFWCEGQEREATAVEIGALRNLQILRDDTLVYCEGITADWTSLEEFIPDEIPVQSTLETQAQVRQRYPEFFSPATSPPEAPPPSTFKPPVSAPAQPPPAPVIQPSPNVAQLPKSPAASENRESRPPAQPLIPTRPGRSSRAKIIGLISVVIVLAGLVVGILLKPKSLDPGSYAGARDLILQQERQGNPSWASVRFHVDLMRRYPEHQAESLLLLSNYMNLAATSLGVSPTDYIFCASELKRSVGDQVPTLRLMKANCQQIKDTTDLTWWSDRLQSSISGLFKPVTAKAETGPLLEAFKAYEDFRSSYPEALPMVTTAACDRLANEYHDPGDHLADTEATALATGHLPFMQELCDSGCKSANISMGNYYLDKTKNTTDERKAFTYFKNAADHGNAGAAYAAGEIEARNLVGTTKDWGQVLQWFETDTGIDVRAANECVILLESTNQLRAMSRTDRQRRAVELLRAWSNPQMEAKLSNHTIQRGQEEEVLARMLFRLGQLILEGKTASTNEDEEVVGLFERAARKHGPPRAVDALRIMATDPKYQPFKADIELFLKDLK